MSVPLRSTLTNLFPPKPSFTAKDLPSLLGKVHLVTGSNTGVGKELASMLYSKDAKVYIAARSKDKADSAIQELRQRHPQSKGSLVFIKLDLSDLSTIKSSVQQFLNAEGKLHCLYNNAGVMSPEAAIRLTAQGYENHIGVNCVGTHLFTKLLTPTLVATAKVEPPNTVRVVWLSSSALEMFAEEGVGLPLDNLDFHNPKPGNVRYGLSKVGNWAQGVEFAKRFKADGIISMPLNPGNLRSELFRDQGLLFGTMAWLVGYPPEYGACTELYAGLSPDITIEKSGDWVIPFGRLYPLRKDLEKATRTKAEGGTGGTHDFWEWNEEQVKDFL